MKRLFAKNDKSVFEIFEGNFHIVQNTTFQMIYCSLHMKEYFKSNGQKWQKILIILFVFVDLKSQISQFDKN